MRTRTPAPTTPLHRNPLVLIAGLAATFGLAGCQPAETADATTEVGAPPAGGASLAAGPAHVQAASPEEAGRYLVVVGGCNDCHTPGYLEPGADVPESEWLVGSPVGFRGPWGTSYPSNLRLLADAVPEDGWVARLHGGGLPPMPWVNVNQMSEEDARSVYRYLRSLGPAGAPAPRAVPPDVEPETPYIDFVPQHMERMPAAQVAAPAGSTSAATVS